MESFMWMHREKHVSPLYTWQDGRGNQPLLEGKSICQILQETYGKEAYTGYGLVTHLYQHQTGKIPKQAVGFCTIMDYLGMVLTGQKNLWYMLVMQLDLGFLM